MAYPKNPDTIVVRNQYYPSGLTEEMVYKYYTKHKKNILKEIDGRFVLLFIYTDVNKWVVKRNINRKPIILNKNNYDEIITGRTVSISVERENPAKYFCIDIDRGPTSSSKDLSDAVDDILESSIRTRFSKGYRIASTASGYHVYLYLNKPMSIGTTHQILKKSLEFEFGDKYVLGGKPPTGNQIKLDVSPTTNKGSHTVIGALTRNGLVCADVTNDYKKLNKNKLIIK